MKVVSFIFRAQICYDEIIRGEITITRLYNPDKNHKRSEHMNKTSHLIYTTSHEQNRGLTPPTLSSCSFFSSFFVTVEADEVEGLYATAESSFCVNENKLYFKTQWRD